VSRNSTRETVALVTRMVGRIVERLAAIDPRGATRVEAVPGVPSPAIAAAANARGAALVSVVLVDVTRCGSSSDASIALPSMREAIPGRAGLRARYVVTPWTGDAARDADLLRRLERALDPLMIVAPEDMGPEAPELACPPLVTRDAAFASEKLGGFWDVLARSPAPSLVCSVAFDAAAE